jgi:hypothetical protein
VNGGHQATAGGGERPVQLMIDKYGEPDEAAVFPCTTSVRGKRVVLVSSKATFDRNLAAPHKDRWNLSLDYGIAPEHGVAPEHFTLLAEFDGSAIVERTAVEALARSYDDEANDQRAHPRPRGRGRRFVKGCWGEA